MLDLINNPVEVPEIIEEEKEELPVVEIERPLRPGESRIKPEEKKEEKKTEPKEEVKVMEAPVKKEKVIPLKDKLGIDIKTSIPNDKYALREKKIFKNSKGKNVTICVFAGIIVVLALVALGIAIIK